MMKTDKEIYIDFYQQKCDYCFNLLNKYISEGRSQNEIKTARTLYENAYNKYLAVVKETT